MNESSLIQIFANNHKPVITSELVERHHMGVQQVLPPKFGLAKPALEPGLSQMDPVGVVLQVALLGKLFVTRVTTEPLVLVDRLDVARQPLASPERLWAEVAGDCHPLVDGS